MFFYFRNLSLVIYKAAGGFEAEELMLVVIVRIPSKAKSP